MGIKSIFLDVASFLAFCQECIVVVHVLNNFPQVLCSVERYTRICGGCGLAEMSDARGLLPNLAQDIIKILKISKVESCSVHVIKALGVKKGSSFPSVQEGRTFRNRSGRYVEADSREGSTDVFAVASQTKIFIALALFLVIQELRDDGQDDVWNTTFTELFNQYRQRLKMRPLPRNPTVKDLLVHRNGLPDLNDFLLAPDGTPLLSKENFLRVVPDLCGEERNEPDAAAKYSNANYVLLVMLIEAIKKCSFSDYLRENVLKPLKMTHTFVSPIPDEVDKSTWATPYVVYEDGRPTQVQNHSSSSDSAASCVMGMHSCTKDMAILYQSFFHSLQRDPEIKTLKKDLIERMIGLGKSGFISSISGDEDVGYTACGLASLPESLYLGSHQLNRLILGDDSSTSFNLGRGKDFNSKVYSQAGTITGFSCCSILVPETYEAVIVMTNTVGLNDAADHVARLTLQALYDLKVPRAGLLKHSPFRQKIDIVKKAQRSAKKTGRRWKDLEIRKPQNATLVLNPERLVGRYKGKYCAQYLIITNENDDTSIIISDGGSNQSGRLGLKSVRPGRFRIIPQAPGIDVFGSWVSLELDDVSPANAPRITRLSRTRRTAEGEDDEHYEYQLLRDPINDH